MGHGVGSESVGFGRHRIRRAEGALVIHVVRQMGVGERIGLVLNADGQGFVTIDIDGLVAVRGGRRRVIGDEERPDVTSATAARRVRGEVA